MRSLRRWKSRPNVSKYRVPSRIDAGTWLTRPYVDGPGTAATDPDRVPEDLVRLQLGFLRADAECMRVSAGLPSSLDIAAGLAVIDDRQRFDLDTARAERLAIVLAKNDHPWWSCVDNRYEADVRLRAIVQERLDRARHRA